MTSYFVQRFLEDAGIEMTKTDFDRFIDFARFYFRELVETGAFLRDVPYVDLTTRAKYRVLRGALELWKKAEHEPKMV